MVLLPVVAVGQGLTLLDTLTPPRSPAEIYSPCNGSFGQAVALGDFDGDGLADLAVVRGSPTALYLYYSQKNGFTDPIVLTSMAGQVKFADVNNDGIQDLIVIFQQTISVYYGRTSRLTGPALSPDWTYVHTAPFTGGATPPVVDTIDYNYDGVDDLLFGVSSQDTALVFYGFCDRPSFCSVRHPSSVATSGRHPVRR